MLVVDFNPFPILETDRLNLRELSLQDAEEIFELRSDPLAMKFIGKSLLRSIHEAERLIDTYVKNATDNASITWGIVSKDENRVIGTIGYHTIDKDNHRAEIGYMIHPDCWGKGLMNEAVGEVLKFGLEVLRLHSIEAKVNPANEQSCKILSKHDFKKEAHFKENFYFEGKFQDTIIYSLVKTNSIAF